MDPSQFDALCQYLGPSRIHGNNTWHPFVVYEGRLSDSMAIAIELSDEELVWIRLKYPNVVIDDRV